MARTMADGRADFLLGDARYQTTNHDEAPELPTGVSDLFDEDLLAFLAD